MVRRQNTEIQFYLPRDFSLGLLNIIRTGLQETDPIWAIVIRPKDFEQFPFKTKVCNCHVRHLFRYLGPQKKCEFPTSIVVLWKRVYSIWKTCSFWRKISRKRVGKEESIIETFKKKIRNTVFTQPPSVVNIRDRSFFFFVIEVTHQIYENSTWDKSQACKTFITLFWKRYIVPQYHIV